jgi:hypothetical protein
MEIITPDFSISQEKNQSLDVHIAKEENGEMLVKNDGDKITVKTKNSENKTEVKQISSELVAINPDSDTVDILKDADIMSAFMTKNNISVTFTLSTEKIDWPRVKTEEKEDLIAMQTEHENLQITQNVKSESIENKVNDNKDENIIVTQEEKDPILE